MSKVVESADEKIIRLAKRNAYGACDKHQGHFDWECFLLGAISMVPVLVLIASTQYYSGLADGQKQATTYGITGSWILGPGDTLGGPGNQITCQDNGQPKHG